MKTTTVRNSVVQSFLLPRSYLERRYDTPRAKILRAKVLRSSPEDNGHLNLSVYTPPNLAELLSSDRFSVTRQLREIATKNPDQILLMTWDRIIKAKDFYTEAKKIAFGLRAIGVEPGDSVAFMTMPTDHEFLIYFVAAQMIGASVAPINFLQPDEIIPKMFDKAKAKVLVVGRDSRLRGGANLLSTCMLKNAITLGRTEHHPLTKFLNQLETMDSYSIESFVRAVLKTGAYHPGFYTDENIRSYGELSDDEILWSPPKDATSVTLFSSGTVKDPTLIKYSNEMIALSVASVSAYFDITEKDKMLSCLTDSHLAALIVKLGAMAYKCPLVCTEIPTGEDPKTIRKALKVIDGHKVTIFPGAPRIISSVLELAVKRTNRDENGNKTFLVNQGNVQALDSIRLIFSGAAPINEYLIDQIREININREKRGKEPIVLVDFHASTECGPYLCNILFIKADSISKKQLIYPGVKVMLSTDGENELLVQPISMPKEIKPEQTCTIDSQIFFRTRDQYKMEEDGSLTYVCRLDKRLNRNGKKIAPELIEGVFDHIKGIKDVHVFGWTDEERGTDIACAIVTPDLDKKGNPIPLQRKDIREILEERFHRGKIKAHAYIPEVILIKPEGIPQELCRVAGKEIPTKKLLEKYGAEAKKGYLEFQQEVLQLKKANVS